MFNTLSLSQAPGLRWERDGGDAFKLVLLGDGSVKVKNMELRAQDKAKWEMHS